MTLLAIGLSVLLWTAAARPAPAASPDVATMSADGFCLVAGDTHDRSDADQQWRAQHHTIAAVTESIWKSSLVHADLAAILSPRTFDAARAASSPDPPAPSAPPYLRHTPLLI